MKSLMLFAGLLALPFAPPAGWKPLPGAVVPPPLIHWEEGRSTFSVFGLGAGGDAKVFDRIFAAQASASGSTIMSSSTQQICGRPGVRVVVHSDAAKSFTIEQAESIGGSLYVMSYARGDGDAVSAPISQFLSTTCNGATIIAAKPPLGWTVVAGRLIGVWVGRSPAYSISLISGPPHHYLQQFSNDAQQELALSGASVGNGSMETRTLCGLPATYATSHVASKNGQPLDITTEHTQSSSVAYTLIYTRPSSAGDDPKVDASLASLCAAVSSPPPPKSPSPSPSPSPSESPTPSPSPSPSPTQTPTPSPSPTQTPTPSPSPTETPTPSPSPTETPTPSPSPKEIPSPSPSPSETSSPTPSLAPTTSPTALAAGLRQP